jgi:hypothetical protein
MPPPHRPVPTPPPRLPTHVKAQSCANLTYALPRQPPQSPPPPAATPPPRKPLPQVGQRTK